MGLSPTKYWEPTIADQYTHGHKSRKLAAQSVTDTNTANTVGYSMNSSNDKDDSNNNSSSENPSSDLCG